MLPIKLRIAYQGLHTGSVEDECPFAHSLRNYPLWWTATQIPGEIERDRIIFLSYRIIVDNHKLWALLHSNRKSERKEECREKKERVREKKMRLVMRKTLCFIRHFYPLRSSARTDHRCTDKQSPWLVICYWGMIEVTTHMPTFIAYRLPVDDSDNGSAASIAETTHSAAVVTSYRTR